MKSLLKPLLLALPIFLLNFGTLTAQSVVEGTGLSKARPHLWIGAQANFNTSDIIFPDMVQYNTASSLNPDRLRLRPALDLRISYSWFQFRAGLQSANYGFEYSTFTVSGYDGGVQSMYTRNERNHAWQYNAIRIPLSLGLAPNWKLAPYFNLGMFLDATFNNSYVSTGTTTTTTETMNHALGCGCFWTETTENSETLPSLVTREDNGTDVGVFANIGVSYQPFSRHRFNLEVEIGQGSRSLGAESAIAQRYRRVSLGYGLRVF